MRHQPGQFYFLVEVEKDSIQSVFYFLKELNYAVFSDATSDKLLSNSKLLDSLTFFLNSDKFIFN